MALKATIFKVNLQISDMDRQYYQGHDLTIARHPSENDERMMLRLMAFAMNASDSLSFTKGISTTEEPDIWQKNLTDDIELWIELGQPDEKRIKQAANKSDRVKIYTYNKKSSDVWWKQNQQFINSLKNVEVFEFSEGAGNELTSLVEKTMQLQCMIEQAQMWLSNESHTIEISCNRLV
jgi:uncharacterized protein YaeQ